MKNEANNFLLKYFGFAKFSLISSYLFPIENDENMIEIVVDLFWHYFFRQKWFCKRTINSFDRSEIKDSG